MALRPALSFPARQPELETASLHLRALSATDAEPYFQLCSQPLVMQTWGVLPHPSLAHSAKVIAATHTDYQAQRSIRWGIFLKPNLTLIGDVGFWRLVPERWRAEAGAKLSPEYWRSGIMTEALGAVLHVGFNTFGLHSVEANILTENKGAIKLVERLGFRFNGTLFSHSYNPYTDRFCDTLLYSLHQEGLK